MTVDGKYAKTFRSNDITRLKYDELVEFATLLRDHRNEVSRLVNSDLAKYLEYDRYRFVTEMRQRFRGTIPSSFDKHLYAQVFDCYERKFSGIERRLRFDSVRFVGFETYRRNTGRNRKGDLKRVATETRNTPLSVAMTYLVRYGNAGTVDYVRSQMDSCSEDKRRFYENVLRCCDKFGFGRLLALALARRGRIVSAYGKNPIEFRSLSFSGRCRKSKILAYNKRFGSEVNAFVSLSGIGRKSFDIPVKFCKDYHGRVGDYAKRSNDYEYTLKFDVRCRQVDVVLVKDGKREIPVVGDSVVGIDVNCKHNLFSLSDGTSYDYDRRLVRDFCRLSSETDKLKAVDLTYSVGKRRQFKFDALKRKMVKSEQQLISSICRRLQSHGVNHVAMEDLDNSFGRCFVSDRDFSDVNYNRKVRFLGLSSLKDEFRHIAAKYGISVSLVHACYTSKACPSCGCIDDGNRPDQETFRCVECGHEDNADHNAALNIRDRVLSAVLRERLLKKTGSGSFEPRHLRRDAVKDVLLSCRRSLDASPGSERGQVKPMTPFDHV